MQSNESYYHRQRQHNGMIASRRRYIDWLNITNFDLIK